MEYGYGTEGYYQKMLELQAKLRKSEEERLKLEQKFNEMMQVSRDVEHDRLRLMRHRYHKFLEEDKLRQERNENILRALDRIEGRAKILEAKTSRFKAFRKQYESHIKRMHHTKTEQQPPIENTLPSQQHRDYSHSNVRKKLFRDETVEGKLDMLEQYLRDNFDNFPPIKQERNTVLNYNDYRRPYFEPPDSDSKESQEVNDDYNKYNMKFNNNDEKLTKNEILGNTIEKELERLKKKELIKQIAVPDDLIEQKPDEILKDYKDLVSKSEEKYNLRNGSPVRKIIDSLPLQENVNNLDDSAANVPEKNTTKAESEGENPIIENYKNMVKSLQELPPTENSKSRIEDTSEKTEPPSDVSLNFSSHKSDLLPVEQINITNGTRLETNDNSADETTIRELHSKPEEGTHINLDSRSYQETNPEYNKPLGEIVYPENYNQNIGGPTGDGILQNQDLKQENDEQMSHPEQNIIEKTDYQEPIQQIDQPNPDYQQEYNEQYYAQQPNEEQGYDQLQYSAEQPEYQAEQPEYQADQQQYSADQSEYQTNTTEQPEYQTDQQYSTEQADQQYPANQAEYHADQQRYPAEQQQYSAEQTAYQADQQYPVEQPEYQVDQTGYQADQEQYPTDQQYSAEQPEYQADQTGYQADQEQYPTDQQYSAEQPEYQADQTGYQADQEQYPTDQQYSAEQPEYQADQQQYSTDQTAYQTDQQYSAEQLEYQADQQYPAEQPEYQADQQYPADQQQYSTDQADQQYPNDQYPVDPTQYQDYPEGYQPEKYSQEQAESLYQSEQEYLQAEQNIDKQYEAEQDPNLEPNSFQQSETLSESLEQSNVVDNKPIIEKKLPNIADMLDTDTSESVKQETKVSNDSDFDFSKS